MSDDPKVISLQQHRDRLNSDAARVSDGKTAASEAEPLPGRLFWLHCPACESYEFTELEIEGGRTHRPCGTIVEERAVEIDVRAEYTIADLNQRRLRELQELIADQVQRVKEYQQRLTIIAGKPPIPYDITGAITATLPIAEMDPLGLLVSQALHNPQARFGKEAPANSPHAPEPPTNNEPEPA